MLSFFIWLKAMLRSTTPCWNSAHVATRCFKTHPYRWLVLDTRALASHTVSKLGCSKLIFIEPGAKINGQYYRDVLLTKKLLPAIRSIAGDMFVFQQDNAPAASTSFSWKSRASALWDTPAQLISLDMWPANSPDLNSVDYRVWGMLQQRVYRVPIRNTDELRKSLVATWAEFQQTEVDYAVDQWRKRLKACIRAEGGHFEHLLWRCLPDIRVATHHNWFFSEPPMFGGTQHYLKSDEKVQHFTR